MKAADSQGLPTSLLKPLSFVNTFLCVCVQVEEGGKVESLQQPLQVGDELIVINDVELTGSRQEAVALVKGSYKTLQLTVRRYTRVCVLTADGLLCLHTQTA